MNKRYTLIMLTEGHDSQSAIENCITRLQSGSEPDAIVEGEVKLPTQPQAGQTYIDGNDEAHIILEITSMFHKPSIKYIADGNNCYITLQCLHLHSSGDFWFKEPLTDQIK